MTKSETDYTLKRHISLVGLSTPSTPTEQVKAFHREKVVSLLEKSQTE